MKREKARLFLAVLVVACLSGMVFAGGAWAATINVPGDQATIQGAVNAASPNDTILVAPGTYTGTIDVSGTAKANITVQGTNASTVIIKPATTMNWNTYDPGNPSWNTRKVAIRVVRANGFTLKNVTVDCTTIAGNNYAMLVFDSTGCKVEGCTFKDLGRSDASGYYAEVAVRNQTASNSPFNSDSNRATLTVQGSTLRDVGRLGISAHGYTVTTASGCTFEKTWPDFGYAMDIGSQAELVATSNTVRGFDTAALSDGSASGGIYASTSFTQSGVPAQTKDVTITGNTVSDCQSGIIVGNEWESLQGDVDLRAVVSNNNVYDSQYEGLRVSGSGKTKGATSNVSGSGNRFCNNGGTGVWIGAGYASTLNVADITVDLSGGIYGNDSTAVTIWNGPTAGSVYNTTIRQSDFSGVITGIDNSAGGSNSTATSIQNYYGSATDAGTVTVIDPVTAGGCALYDDSTGASVPLSNGMGTVSIPAGCGSVVSGAVVVVQVDAPTAVQMGGAQPGTVFIDATPDGADFGSNKDLWPTITLRTTHGLADYVPYYYNGSAWVPYASSDYCDMSNVNGQVTEVFPGGIRSIQFKVKHFTPIGGGGGGTPTGANTDALMVLALLSVGIGAVLMRSGRRGAPTSVAH